MKYNFKIKPAVTKINWGSDLQKASVALSTFGNLLNSYILDI